MYEGKNVHYSAVDGKPLCSYSGKLCKQRRLNGYAFCIRHVLEDPDARFKQCEYVARYNNQRCTNPIPENEDRVYCNSHMQVLGLVPKTVRKKKTPIVENPSPPNTFVPSTTPLMLPPKATKSRTPKKGAKGQPKAAPQKVAQPEGKRRTTRPRTKSPLITEEDMPCHQEAGVRTEPSLQLMNHPSNKNINISKTHIPTLTRRPDFDIKELKKLKPVLQLWSTLRLIKWQEKQLATSDVYPITDNHTDSLICTDMDSTSVEIKRDDDFSVCQYYDNLVAQRKAECEDGMKHSESQLRVTRDNDARSCGVIRKTLKALKEAPVAGVAVSLVSSNKELARLKRKRALAKGQICCMAIVGQFQCGGKPLPYTRHCVQHICLNKSQYLFRSCAGFVTTEAGVQQQCPFPVTDITQCLPFCKNHVTSTTQPPEPTATISPSQVTTEPPAKQPRRKAPAQSKRAAPKPRTTKPRVGTAAGGHPVNNAAKRTAKSNVSASGPKSKVVKSVVRAKQAHIPVFTGDMVQQNEKTSVNMAEQTMNVQPPPLLSIGGVRNEKHVQPPPLVRVKQGGNQDVMQRGAQIPNMPMLQTPTRAQVPVNLQMTRPSSSDSSSGSESGSSDDSSDDGSSDDGLVMATNEGMPQYEQERLQSVYQMEQAPSRPSHELPLGRQSDSNSPFLGPITTPTHPSPSQFQRHFPRHFSTDSYNDLSPGYGHHHRPSSHHEFSDRPFTSPHDVSGTVRSLYPLPFDDIQAPAVDPPAFEFDLQGTSPYKQSPAGGSPLFPHHVNYTHQHQTNTRGMMRELNTTPTGHDSLVSSLFHSSELLDPPSPTH